MLSIILLFEKRNREQIIMASEAGRWIERQKPVSAGSSLHRLSKLERLNIFQKEVLIMKNKKELLIAAKNELADNERKYHPSLIEIEWLSPDELTELWPEWTVGDVYCEFLYMYFAIKESKDVREKEQMKNILKNSNITKLINIWDYAGCMDNTEEEKIIKGFLEEVFAW